jgi:hypothetical protein
MIVEKFKIKIAINYKTFRNDIRSLVNFIKALKSIKILVTAELELICS